MKKFAFSCNEILGLIFISAICHALVLWLVFPGYYRPLSAHHSDYYIAPALAQSGISPLDYIFMPRPVGFLFLRMSGFLGINTSTLPALLVTFMNLALIANILRRIFKISFTLNFIINFILYLLMVFSHPFFYTFSTWDAMAQLSLLFLLLAGLSIMQLSSTRSVFSWGALAFTFSLAAFLSKETYGLSAALIAATFGVLVWQQLRLRAFLPILIIMTTLGLGLFVNHLNGSPYTGGANTLGSPYHIDLSPASLLREWWQYGLDGLSLLALAIIVGVNVIIFIISKDINLRIAVLLLPTAGVLAWLPHSALPNHHYAGYSWVAANLLFAPILLLPLEVLKIPVRGALQCLFLLFAVFGMTTPDRYDRNNWMLEQEARQRKLTNSLRGLVAEFKPSASGNRILVTGLSYPFSPFDHGHSLRAFNSIKDIRYDVIFYGNKDVGMVATPQPGTVESLVNFVPPTVHDFSTYTQVWAFRGDGSLVKKILPDDYNRLAKIDLGLTQVNAIIYPALLDIFPVTKDISLEERGYILLNCGTQMLEYKNFDVAEICLSSSLGLIKNNPLPAYYLGVVNEKRAKFSQAQAWYQRAFDMDGEASPNPAFTAALDRMKRTVVETE